MMADRASPTPRLHWKQPLLPTPFHARTSEANRLNAWGPWGGYTTALAYEDEAMEYTAIRNQASLYDLSPMVKYRIAGPDAAAFLDRLTIRNVAKLPVGAVHYTAWCDDAGHLLDDGTLFRHGADGLPALLPGAPPPLAPRQRHSASTPTSRRSPRPSPPSPSRARPPPPSSAPPASRAVETLKPFRLTRATLAGIELTVSRTGFTGDLGYELWTTPDRALDLWDALMAAGALHGLRPIGTNALNLARIEAGFIITGMDFVPADTAVRADRARSPFELGLDWMIDWQKGHFTGRRALLAEKRQGLHLVPRRPRHRRQRPRRPRHRLPCARRRRSATSPPPPGRRRPSATSRSPTSAAPTTPGTPTSGSRSTPCASSSTPS